VEIHFGDSRYGSKHDVFDARLRGCGDCDSVPVTAKTCRDPKHVDRLDRLRSWDVAFLAKICLRHSDLPYIDQLLFKWITSRLSLQRRPVSLLSGPRNRLSSVMTSLILIAADLFAPGCPPHIERTNLFSHDLGGVSADLML
jgi:hypothetical protein